MGYEKGGRGHQEHNLVPEGQNTASAISQASLVLCSKHSLQGLVQTTPSLGLEVRALTPLHEENYRVSRLE